MGIIKIICFFLLFFSMCTFFSCEKANGTFFKVQARNDFSENVIINFGIPETRQMKSYIISPGETKLLAIQQAHTFNGWGHEKKILLVFAYMMDSLSVSSSLGVTQNLTWKDFNMRPHDTLFEFTPIPANANKGTAVYTLVIDSALYR